MEIDIIAPKKVIEVEIEAVVRQGGSYTIIMVNPVHPYYYTASGTEGNAFNDPALSNKVILEFKRNNQELWPVGLDENGDQNYPTTEEYAYNPAGTFTIAYDYDPEDKIKILYREP